MNKLSTIALISFTAIATASIASSSFAQSAGKGGRGGGPSDAASEKLLLDLRRTNFRKRRGLPNSCSCKLKTINSLNGQQVTTTICLKKVIRDNAIMSVRCRG